MRFWAQAEPSARFLPEAFARAMCAPPVELVKLRCSGHGASICRAHDSTANTRELVTQAAARRWRLNESVSVDSISRHVLNMLKRIASLNILNMSPTPSPANEALSAVLDGDGEDAAPQQPDAKHQAAVPQEAADMAEGEAMSNCKHLW